MNGSILAVSTQRFKPSTIVFKGWWHLVAFIFTCSCFNSTLHFGFQLVGDETLNNVPSGRGTGGGKPFLGLMTAVKKSA